MKRLMMAVLGLTCMAGVAVAGSIDSPGAPGSAASKMPAISDIYTYLTTGTPVPTPSTSFTEPSAGPGSTGHTLTEVYAAVATPFPQCDAAVADVKSGKKFFCTQAGSWGVRTGTLVQQQYCTLLKTGQTSVYKTYDDGTWQSSKGKAFSYSWDSGTDTVKDNVTGLIWASKGTGAGCKSGSALSWSSAIDWAHGLTFGGYSDWRLPNRRELESLICLTQSGGSPYINKTYFTIPGEYMWCSTTADTSSYAWIISFGNTYVSPGDKGTGFYVRAVRGGE